MKFLKLIASISACLSFVNGYYSASRVTHYGGEGDEESAKNPFCQDYGVDKYLSGIKYYVALSVDVLSVSTAKTYCGKTIKLKNSENGRSLEAMIVDSCANCGYGNIDLSVEAFRYLSKDDLGKGVLKTISYCIYKVDNRFGCSSSSSTTSKKKTTTTTKSSARKSTNLVRSAGNIYIELENGDRRGYTSISKSIDGYSGRGYIKITKPSSSSSRSYVRTYVNMKYSGKYKIILKYNNSNSSRVTNRLIINNNTYKIKFSKTGSSWKKLEIDNVAIKSGTNTIEVRATDGYMSFDYVLIK